jgi:hypothetical protein
MGAEGGIHQWLTEGKVAPSPAFVSPEVSATFECQDYVSDHMTGQGILSQAI